MHRRHRRAPLLLGMALAALLASGSAASIASAAEPQQPSFPPPEEDNGTERPAAPDLRTGHLYLSAAVGAVGPVGAFAPNVSAQSIAGVGWDVGAILGVGIGRYGVLQIYGNRTAFASPAGCSVPGCGGTGYAVGLGVTYHLVQGLAVDPWGSFGTGYRRTMLQVETPGLFDPAHPTVAQTFQGWDVARVAFGGDFYPVPWFGFGPFIEADVGTNLQRPPALVALPPNIIDGPRTYGFFQIGFRVSFDPMRRGSLPRAPAVGGLSAPGM